jgi:hypothetical protein
MLEKMGAPPVLGGVRWAGGRRWGSEVNQEETISIVIVGIGASPLL